VILISKFRRLLVAAGLALAPIALAGCPSPGPSPTPYSCGTSQDDFHCYARVNFTNHAVRGGIRGWQARIVVPPVMNGGDGLITDEFWLGSFSGSYWIETGYGAGVSGPNGPNVYFWADTEPGVGLRVYLLGVVPSADTAGWATFTVYQTGSSTFAISVQTPTVSYAATSNIPYFSDPSTEGYINMGQELAGSTGAVADYVTFANYKEFSGGQWSDATSGGAQAENGQPPYGLWTPASQWPPTGLFWTECCISPSSSPSAAPTSGPHSTQPASPPPVRSLSGVPAIRVSRPGHVPAFTAAEAQAYAIANTPGTTAAKGQQVAEITFMTAAQLSAAQGSAVAGLPADTPICYVLLNGRFTAEEPPRPGQKSSTILHFTHAFMVFDSRTGALLLRGDH
jgi:hypothetical protein